MPCPVVNENGVQTQTHRNGTRVQTWGNLVNLVPGSRLWEWSVVEVTQGDKGGRASRMKRGTLNARGSEEARRLSSRSAWLVGVNLLPEAWRVRA